jgi:ribosomal protein L19E
MKPLPLVLVALLAGSVGAASGWIASRCAQCTASVATGEAVQVDIQPQAGLAPKPTTREAELAAKVESLERALDSIHQDVAELRSGNSRTPAIEPEKAPIEQDAITFAATHKSAIKAVIEEDRQDQLRKAEEERKQRAIEQSQQQAERVAQKLGMDPAQTKQLQTYAETQRLRFDELRTAMQDGTGDPQAMRQTFQDFRSQSQTELTNLFGADLAGKIMEEGLGMGMGRAAFAGPGGGGQDRNPGGGGRRGRAAGGTGGSGGGTGSRNTGGPGGGG